MIDSTGTLWLGSGNDVQWLNKERSRFTIYQDKERTKKGNQGGAVHSFAEASNGSLWLGTDKGLVHWNPAANSFTPVKLIVPGDQNRYPLNPDVIHSVITDEKGMIWCGGMSGPFRYNPVTGSIKHHMKTKANTTSLTSNMVNRIYEDHEGTIWVGTNGGGLCSLNRETGKFTRYPYTSDNSYALQAGNKRLIGAEVNAIYEDRQGTLWIGTNGSTSAGGLHRFNRSDSTFIFFCNVLKGFSDVGSIREDKNGLLWIGTWGGGLIHFNGFSFLKYNKKR